MNVTEIFFFRHAQTLWNLEKRFQGQKNSELSETGILQSRQMSEKIKEIAPDIFITSELKRTKDTLMHALGNIERQKYQIEMSDFNEAAFGCWEGMLIEDVMRQFSAEFRTHREQPHLFKMKDAESYEEIQNRALEGVERIIKEFPGKKVAVITHGMTLLCLIGYIRNIPTKHIRDKVSIPDNTDYIKTCWYC